MRPMTPEQQFWQQWREGTRPDLAAFLAARPSLPSGDAAAVISIDQYERWLGGERIEAEEYGRLLPGDAGRDQALCDIVYGEYLLREQLGVRPNDMRASIGLGTALLAQDKPDQALPFVKVAANEGAFRKRATTLLANLARLRGDTDAATIHETDANRMPEDEVPPDPFVWDYMTLQVGRKDAFGRIGELENANRLQETIPLLLDMTRKYPEAKTYFNLGVNLSALGDHRAAIGHFETTILLDPSHAKAHNSLGLSLAVVADTVAEPSKSEYQRRAIVEFDRAIELKSDFALPYIFKGQVLYARGDQTGAFDTLRKIVAIRPDVADAHATLIVLLEKAGRIAEAKSLLPAAERVVPLSDETFQAARLRLNSK